MRAVLAANADGDILQRYDEDLDAAFEQARKQGDVTPLMQTVKRWWFEADAWRDPQAPQGFADLPPAARASRAAFMDAVVIVDPVQYQRRRDERDDVSVPLRSPHFGPGGGGLVTFLVYPPDDLVLVVKLQWLGGLATLGSPGRPYATGRGPVLIGSEAITFCSWQTVIAMVRRGTGSWTEPPVQTVQLAASAARLVVSVQVAHPERPVGLLAIGPASRSHRVVTSDCRSASLP